jgi:pimeloyl-ACP methyl ester carboxylesterase
VQTGVDQPGVRGRLLAVAAVTLALATLTPITTGAASAAAHRAAPTRAIVLVSGLASSSPFSSPAPACAGKEGPSWGLSGGIAPALKRAGFKVFTAPVREGSASPPPACAKPSPGASTWLDSTGDDDANGAALNRFLSFLRRAYRIDVVTLVGHSDGGIWSRSAIATHTGAPAIQGLVTVGSPFAGSPVADLGTTAANMSCAGAGAICPTVQAIVQGIVSKIGGSAVTELSSAYLETWNPKQSLAGCRVTTIEGTAVNPSALPPPQPAISGYYFPSDGLVGKSSAADQPALALDGSRIPAAPIRLLANGGSFPVYHTPQLGSPSELNDPGVNAAIIRALRRPTATCAGGRTQKPATLAVQLLQIRTTGSGGGSLGAASKGDVMLALGSATAACGSASLTASPLLPVKLIKTYVAGRCGALSSSGTAVLLHTTASTAQLTLSGRTLTVALHGPKISALAVRVLLRGKWVLVSLKRGRGTVPAGGLVQLRLTGRGSGGISVGGFAPMYG